MAIPPCFRILTLVFLLVFTQSEEFIYNGFRGYNNSALLHLDGFATIHSNGLLQLANFSPRLPSHAFYTRPIVFRQNLTFSTTFVFAMVPQVSNPVSHGIVFAIAPTMQFIHSPSNFLGLFNATTSGLAPDLMFGVELQNVLNAEFRKRARNHVGIDVNGLIPVDIAPASYFSDKEGINRSLVLGSGKPIQVWIGYDGVTVNVALAPLNHPKPSRPLLSKKLDLSSLLMGSMHIGFSSSTCHLANSNYILGWSWNQSGPARDLDPSKLPSLPMTKNNKKNSDLTFRLLLITLLLLLLMIVGGGWVIIRRNRYSQLLEPWEKEHAPHRFRYKDLYVATKGFRNTEILGSGGFGKVYRGKLQKTGGEIAVKQVSHDSKQGMKEFISEIVSMRRLRHRNLVQLLGYCRRRGELLLVYDYMPNGSLDKLLFRQTDSQPISWCQRFKIIKGVASALLYLHEGWDQVVLHRDVKASNVLLDAEMNPCLGDFGLARLYDRGSNPRTTRVVGTIGYLAPESGRTQKATTSTDVYSFGIFLLEVASGRRPMNQQHGEPGFFLLDWVYGCWKKGNILEASDGLLEGSYNEDEMRLVLKMGLMCANPKAESRPSMRQMVLALDGADTLPADLPSDYDPQVTDAYLEGWGAVSSFSNALSSTSSGGVSHGYSSSLNSILRYGR